MPTKKLGRPKKIVVERKKRGRPRIEFDKTKKTDVLELFANGGSLTNLAAMLNVSIDTVDRWRKRDKEFLKLVKIGLVKSQHWWQEEGKTNLQNKEFNSTLWYMNMKNRFQWHDHKPTYPLKKLKKFKGSLQQKNKAIDDALAAGIISTDEHNVIQNSLLAEAKITQLDCLVEEVKAIKEHLGLTKST
jgi:DNA-binding transcriptional regulator YiaG